MFNCGNRDSHDLFSKACWSPKCAMKDGERPRQHTGACATRHVVRPGRVVRKVADRRAT